MMRDRPCSYSGPNPWPEGSTGHDGWALAAAAHAVAHELARPIGRLVAWLNGRLTR